MRFDVNDPQRTFYWLQGLGARVRAGALSTFERRFELSRICYVHFGTIGTSGLPLGLGQVGDELDAAG